MRNPNTVFLFNLVGFASLTAACVESAPSSDAYAGNNASSSPAVESAVPSNSVGLSDAAEPSDAAVEPSVGPSNPGAARGTSKLLDVTLLPAARVVRMAAADGDTDTDAVVVDAIPAEPTEDPSVAAPVAPDSAESESFQTGAPVVTLALHVLTPTAHVDAPETQARAAVQSLDGSAVAGATVGAVLHAEGWTGAPLTAACTTGDDGTCLLDWTVPESAFEFGADAIVSASSGDAAADATVAVFQAPESLHIDGPGAGIQLPISPELEGDTFSVPVYVESNGFIPAAYDLQIGFDPTRLRIDSVSAGACETFAVPVSNAAISANSTGTLFMNAIASPGVGSCASDSPVHVATLTFTVLEGASGEDETAALPVSCTLRDLFDVNFAHLAANKPCNLADATGTGLAGELLVRPAL